jgi:hypothetical protein
MAGKWWREEISEERPMELATVKKLVFFCSI